MIVLIPNKLLELAISLEKYKARILSQRTSSAIYCSWSPIVEHCDRASLCDELKSSKSELESSDLINDRKRPMCVK